MNGIPLSAEQLQQIATNGSPLMLRSVGRLWGLGTAEQDALVRGGFPGWALLLMGLGGGFVAGAFVHRKWPGAMSKVLGGK